MIQIVSGLVGYLVCVESRALISNGLLQTGEFVQKMLSATVKDCLPTAAEPAKREEGGHNLLPLRAPQGLLKEGQQGLMK